MLASATKLPEKIPANAPLNLTLVLNRTDEQGFERFLRGLQDPQSPTYRLYLSPREQADRFGPTVAAYDEINRWLQEQGFKVDQGSANRLTVTATATRAQVERAFRVRLGSYQLGDRQFYGNDREPVLPPSIAPHVQAVIGLSNLAQPIHARGTITTGAANPFGADLPLSCWVAQRSLDFYGGEGLIIGGLAGYQCMGDMLNLLNLAAANASSSIRAESSAVLQTSAAGAGQKVGLVQFDNFDPADVQDFLSLIGRPSQFSQLSQVHVAGGAGAAGADESEVLLDIAAVMSLAPGAQVIVYDAPFKGRGSFQTVFNAMIHDHVNIISNSWAYCEDQTTLADVESIDSILASAAAAGITVVSGAGDNGATCLNGSKNIAHVPASSPHITAVGGTTITQNIGGTYGGEKWWDSANNIPPGGQGGFGISHFFARPAYQNGLTTEVTRSIPDVTAPADPRSGYIICQHDAGGCPTGLLYGGTSVAAPLWAAIVAVLNQQENRELGFLNPILYPLVNTKAFHSAAEMGSDFAHVGLGSPNVDQLHLSLTKTKPGAISTAKSFFGVFPPTVIADGQSKAGIAVLLVDAHGNSISGQQVNLTMNDASHAVVTALNDVTNESNGAALFTVTDTTLEKVSFTATVNGLKLPETPTVTFVSAPAAAGGITASPTTVPANDSDKTTITVTLRDAKGNPSPGKLVDLSQGNGASFISTTSGMTDATGQVQFTAVDAKAETITYKAIDVTDQNLPIPGSAVVHFVNPSGFCAGTNSYRFGTAAAGYAVTTFASNFQQDCYTGIGPIGLSFDAHGTLLVGDYGNGIYAFNQPGLSAGPATLVGSIQAPYYAGLVGITFSKDARLYAVMRYDTKLLEVDPKTGMVIRVAANLGQYGLDLHQDPISGDMFVSGGDYLLRVKNFAAGSSTVTQYSKLSGDGFAVAPDGTIYVATGIYGYGPGIIRVDGTSSATPGAQTPVAALPGGPDGIALEANPAHPGKPILYVNRNDGVITKIDTSALPTTLESACKTGCTDIYTGGSRGDFVTVGPDGCLYATQSDRIVKVTKADGTCGLRPTNTAPQLVITPGTVSPAPAQGTPVTFTASFKNVAVPADVAVTFVISGANPGPHLVRTDANGKAIFTYSGVAAGTDQLVATAEINGSLLTSNQVGVHWIAGKHTTLLSLNQTPGGGAPNVPLKLTAGLQDLSARPVGAVAGATVIFKLAGRSCSAVTDNTGAASCSVTPTVAAGSYPLTASFAGASGLLGSSASKTVDLIVSPPHQLLNISTRMRVLTGENALIGGFIVTGTEPKKVIIRGLGPSLTKQGVPGALQDPTLELHKPNGSVTTNNDWKDSQRSDIEATTIPPSDDREAAIVATLPPGNYTAILAGKDGTTGVGLVEVYDISQPANAKLANISTRGFVDVGANVMIGGFIAGPSNGTLAKVLLRALGPSLAKAGVAGALQDTILELHDRNGTILAENDNWKEGQQAEIKATGIPPTDDRESAIVTSLAPGNYTAVVRGKGGATGVGLVEVYNLP